MVLMLAAKRSQETICTPWILAHKIAILTKANLAMSGNIRKEEKKTCQKEKQRILHMGTLSINDFTHQSPNHKSKTPNLRPCSMLS